MRKTPLRFRMPIAMRAAMSAAIGLIASCGSGDFTGAHFEELQKDCNETLLCASVSISEGLQKCVDETGSKLGDASEAAQQDFSSRVTRCGSLQGCDYTSCTQSDPNTGYAEVHRPDIINQCMQLTACQIAMGQSVGSTVDDCIAQTANGLNFGTPAQQAAFEGKAARCHGLTACAWSSCP